VKVSSSPEDAEAEGNFTKGLIAAGVPMDTDIIWAPNRAISNTAQTDVDEIKDKLWITTEWELKGVGRKSNRDLETKYNQAFLEYYKGSTVKSMKPGVGSLSDYWEASPAENDSKQCCLLFNGVSSNVYPLNSSPGVVPAFCVR
jgi:hypothetical protein